ncbi:hypothetical protein [Streptomyces flavidovirens]|uniref:hypothetical protein n=1 Tax=Streptomyces flavidovirens TaxID=67298 RepID=UPI003692C93E
MHDSAVRSVCLDVNEFIRTGGEFDAVTDFDHVLRSPYDAQCILPAFGSGNHLHPNGKGASSTALIWA